MSCARLTNAWDSFLPSDRYVYIFVGWDLIETILWYFFCVETVGRTLEELEDIFASPSPVAESKRLHTVAVKRDGGVVVVGDI